MDSLHFIAAKYRQLRHAVESAGLAVWPPNDHVQLTGDEAAAAMRDAGATVTDWYGDSRQQRNLRLTIDGVLFKLIENRHDAERRGVLEASV